MSLNELEKIIKYKFNNINLLEEALVHTSYTNKSYEINITNYERLEFLGDRVLGLVIAEYVFNYFPEANEGLLNNYYQKYVNQDYLSKYSKKISLSSFVKTQKGDNLEDNKSILSDVVESIIGAIYLDSNLINCKNFIMNEIICEDIISTKPIKHPKSVLQEYSLDKYKSLPNYKVIKKSGDDHNPIYTVSVNIKNFDMVLGNGSNLKSAEQDAAQRLLDILKIDIN